MPLIVSLAMIVPGAVCVARVAATRPRASLPALAGSIAMLAAMVAMSVGGSASGALGAPIAWTFALLAFAMAEALTARLRHGRASAAEWHRPVGIIVMAALIAAMSGDSSAGAHHGAGTPVGAVVAAGAILYALAVVVALGARRRTLSPGHAAEGISMVVMTVAMLAMPVA